MAEEELIPQRPMAIRDTGLDFGFLSDLAPKAVYADVQFTSERISQKLKLPVSVIDPLLQHLYREKLIAIRGQVGIQGQDCQAATYRISGLRHGRSQRHLRAIQWTGTTG